MAYSGAIQDTSFGPGKERRAHPRYPILVKATIMIEGLGPIKATARDFGLGGLFITFEESLNPQLHGTFCLIRLELNQQEFLLRAKIAYADGNAAGVSFVNPDAAALEALKSHAIAYHKKQASERAEQDDPGNIERPAPQFNGKPAEELLALCNQQVITALDHLVERFFENVGENLLAFAKENTDSTIVNETFHDIERIDNKKQVFRQNFYQYIHGALQQILSAPRRPTDQDNLGEISVDSLSLVDDDEFNVWLARSKIINRIEMDFAQILSFLERRLSIVYGETIDRQTNPYSPDLFVDAFESALGVLQINKYTTNTCYDTFRMALVDSIGSLYERINRTLIANDVAPDLKIAVNKKASDSNAHEQGGPEETAAAQRADDAVQDDARDGRSQATDGAAASGDPVSEAIRSIENNEPINQQNLYELVSELRNLKDQLHQQIPSGGATQSAVVHDEAAIPQAAPVAPPSYTNQEIINLLSSLKVPALPVRGDGSTLSEFRKQLETRLVQPGPDGEARVLSAQQGQVIDFTENVFYSLLNDLQVAHSVRPWIERLGVPVMMMALEDQSIFTDRSHVVRQVINKLADLEILASAEDEEEQAAVKRAFNWLTNLINTEFDGTDKVFHRAVQQLNILNKVQQDTYERNIKEVIGEVLQEEAESGEAAEVSEAQTQRKKDNLWLRMVHRLEERDWVLFDAYSDEPKRLKIAWIARHKGKFVFVNVMGRKDRVVLDNELARQFEEGSAVVLDGQSDSAMDRAQYTMLQSMHKQLLYQASHDELTGLINKREFERSMSQALDDAVKSNTKHAIAFVELDKFDVITNTFGYEAGNHLVKEIVSLFSAYLDDNNVLARIGTNQLGLMLQETSIDNAVEMIEELMDELHDYRFQWEANKTSVSISTGVAIITATTDDVLKLLYEAESSCSVAKEMGGNRIQIYHAGSGRMSRRKRQMEWATRIDRALDENELFLRCQKIAPIRNTDLHQPHYEILLGLSENLGGNTQLEEFIRAAEHYNRMNEIDKWVIQHAFEWLAENEHAVDDISAFTINLSGQSFNSDALIDFIYQQVRYSGVPIDRVCFEITETAGVSNLSDAADFIQTIKGTGCQFALDDFGSGMSSYSYLRNLPVDYLKIDGVFIKDIVNDPNDLTVVKSITEIAHFMEKTVIAEFVQDDQAVDLLRSVGVDYAQGYGISKPHKLDDLLV